MMQALEGISHIKNHVEIGIQRAFMSRARRDIHPQDIIPQLERELIQQNSLRVAAASLKKHRQLFHSNSRPPVKSRFRMNPPEWSKTFAAMQDTTPLGFKVRLSFYDQNSSIIAAENARLEDNRKKLVQRNFSQISERIFKNVSRREKQYTQSQGQLMELMTAQQDDLLEKQSSIRDSKFVEVTRKAKKANREYRMLQLGLSAFQFAARNMKLKIGPSEVESIIGKVTEQKRHLRYQRRPEIILKKRKEVLSSDLVQQAERSLQFQYHVDAASLGEFQHFLGIRINDKVKYNLQPFSRLGALLFYQDIERAARESFTKNLSIGKPEAAYKALQIRYDIQKKIHALTRDIEEFVGAQSGERRSIVVSSAQE